MDFGKYHYSEEILVQLYNSMILPRLIEEKMINLLRQNKISKWFSGIGQEAISVGVASALEKDEYILPLIRNLGVFTVRGVDLKKLFCQFQGKKCGFTKGRDRSFHFGSKEHHIVGMISHLGPQLAVADGVGLWNKIMRLKKVTAVFSGDGGTSQGDFYEALNVAAVWSLPVIFIIENNGYGLSTPTSQQYKVNDLIDRGKAFGMKSVKIDGNNVLEVYDTIRQLSVDIREESYPVLVEAVTFRMRGHEEASGTKYVPKHLLEEWKEKDPIKNYENYLISKRILLPEYIVQKREELKTLIEYAWDSADKEPPIIPDTKEETGDVYYKHKPVKVFPVTGVTSEKRFINAISDALFLSMKKFPELIIMGQDVGEYGGAFKITDGFLKEFGGERVRNTPLCESAIIGAALGYSVEGGKSVVEMQFADFVTMGFNQIVNNLAKLHYRWGQNADVVIRMPTGGGVGAGPFHSQSTEAWFTHTPGLKVVFPSSCYDAKGLLIASIEDPNPVLFFEHKALYRSVTEKIPEEYYNVEIGKAKLAKEGNDATIITYGMGVHWAYNSVKKIDNASVEIIDLRTLLPLDYDIILKSVRKTGKVIFLQEDCLTGGIAGEVCSWISENCFEYLDAPVMREGALDTPVPFSVQLETNFLPVRRFEEKLKKLLAY